MYPCPTANCLNLDPVPICVRPKADPFACAQPAYLIGFCDTVQKYRLEYPLGTALAGDYDDWVQLPSTECKCQPLPVKITDKATATGKDCAGADLPPVPIIGAVQTVPHPTAVQQAALCPNPQLADILAQLAAINGNTDMVEALQTAANATLLTLADYTDQVESLLATLGSNTDGLETLLSTLGLQTDTLEPLITASNVLLTDLLAQQDTHLITESSLVCVENNGVKTTWKLATYQKWDAETGAFVGAPFYAYTQDGTNWQGAPPAGTVTIGACALENWVAEAGNWCYGSGGAALQAGDELFGSDNGTPVGVNHGATSAADCYLHAVYAMHNGSNIGSFNADDATTPFDSSTHGGILLNDTAKVQAVTNATIAAIEAAAGVSAGTYKATYYLTTTGQAVWVYNAALAAEVANGTFLHIYTGSTDVAGQYQEKSNINTPSSFVPADLAGSGGIRVEVTKHISATGEVLARRIWDDSTEPPTEVVGFDPLLLSLGCKSSVKERTLCAVVSGTLWNIKEVTETTSCGGVTVRYFDPDVSPVVEIPAGSIDSIKHEGACDCCDAV